MKNQKGALVKEHVVVAAVELIEQLSGAMVYISAEDAFEKSQNKSALKNIRTILLYRLDRGCQKRQPFNYIYKIS